MALPLLISEPPHLHTIRSLWSPLRPLSALPFTRQSYEHRGPTEVEVSEAAGRTVGALPEILCFDPGTQVWIVSSCQVWMYKCG